MTLHSPAQPLHRANKLKEDNTVRQDREKGWLHKTEPLIIHVVGLRPHSGGQGPMTMVVSKMAQNM